MRIFFPFLYFLILFQSVWASVPVPYAGKVSINGVNFNGQLRFVFAIYNPSNSKLWDSGSNPIEVPVTDGRYLVLLGGQGMTPLPASLFHPVSYTHLTLPTIVSV